MPTITTIDPQGWVITSDDDGERVEVIHECGPEEGTQARPSETFTRPNAVVIGSSLVDHVTVYTCPRCGAGHDEVETWPGVDYEAAAAAFEAVGGRWAW